jgi:predicted Fe-Mo cluster-binding NifX family protein
MRIALSAWNGRIAPVFDVSRHILLIDIEDGAVVARQEETCEGDDPVLKSRRLAERGPRILICGAVSRAMACALAAYGIQTIPFVAGDVEEILAAFQAGTLPSPSTMMPGCCGRRGRFRGGRGEPERDEEPNAWRWTMPQGDGTGPTGMGPGTGPTGMGPGTGRRRGRCRYQGAPNTDVPPAPDSGFGPGGGAGRGFGFGRGGRGRGLGPGRGLGQGRGAGRGRGQGMGRGGR